MLALPAFAVCSLALAQTPLERNLLSNSSFEEAAGGLPAGWAWSPGRAQATLVVDDTTARSGRRSLKITNPSPQAPEVYGRLSTPMELTVGRTYTLSCYVKGDPATAWIGSGQGWTFRFPFARSADWTRVLGTFTADGSRLEVMVATESVTDGFWVDDVQLQVGAEATPYVFDEPLAPGQSRVRLYQDESIRLGENLVPNSDFEVVDGNRPKGWAWDQRNTDATMTVDEEVAHSGRRSVRFTNGTAFGAHVYGWFGAIGAVPVRSSTTYTVSCFVRSEDPGVAWIGGGPDWRVRFRFSPTRGAWRRVSGTFQTGPEQTEFALMVCTETPTAGFSVDDVQLEEGDEATPYLSAEEQAAAHLLLDVPGTIATGDTLSLGAWTFVPEAAAGAHLRARFTSEQGAVLAESDWQGDLASGLGWADLRWGVGAREAGACTVEVELMDAGNRRLARAEASFLLQTAGEQRERLAGVQDRLAAVQARLRQAREAGLDVAYPLVRVTVVESFCDFVAEDLEHREVERARQQIGELEQLIGEADDELAVLLAGRDPARPVPRYVTSPVRVEGTSFVATVEWPDGRREERPVFFNGYGAFGAVRRDVEKLQGYGLNLIQIEFGPNSTLTGENTVDLGACQEFEAVLDRAAKANVAVNLLLSPHYFPGWAVQKWPAVGGVDGGFIRFSVDAPETRAIHEQFLRTVIPRLRGRPGLHSYCLSNEPIYVDARSDPHNRAGWVAWLRQRYGTLPAAGAAHGAPYATWDDVPLPDARPPQATPLYYDWCRFNNERFAGWHEWMADIIHELDPTAPVHAKIMNTVFGRDCAAWGVDPELFCRLSQIAGNDCGKMYLRNATDWASQWHGENMYFDLLRSCRQQPIFNSENHLIVDRDLDYIPPEHIRNVIWQAAVHGEGASTIWVWERTFDPASDFAGSIMHRPACSAAHGRTALDLMRLAPEVTAFQQAPARVAVVYSIASLIYNPGYTDLLARLYEALDFTGEKVDFITERLLAEGKATQYAAILAPGVTHLPAAALEGLQQFAADREGPTGLSGLRPGARRAILTMGEGCLARDDADQPARIEWGGEVVGLSAERGPALRDEIVRALAAIGLDRPLVVQDAATGQEAWGVEWLTARHDGRLLANLVNYTPRAVQVRLSGPAAGPAQSLFTMLPVAETVELPPLEPMLLSLD